MQLFPSHVALAFKTVTPYSPNNPALDSIEELSYVGFTEVVAPSPYNRVDGVNEFKDGEWNSSVRSGSNGVLKRLDRFVLVKSIDVHLRLLFHLFPR
ncbi:hypothetical protein ABD86_18670 [Paenibacillus alvei]|nr:hypothetical protein [Paenibacillus alvei]MBG9745876.1 hypothetical protein [Paenibacillus alvei]